MSDAGFLSQRSFNPASFGATVAINGGLFALLLTLAANVVADTQTREPPLIDPFELEPVAPVDRDTPVKKREQKIENPPVDHFTTPPVETGGDIIIPPGPTGTGPVIEIDPPVIPETVPTPVKIAALIDPRFKNAFQPDYPAGRIRAEQEGVAVVRVLIGVDGRVKAVEGVRADHEEFLKETRAHALKKWRFKPATEGGTPVESWKEMTVRFQFPD
jgi:protein TonB